MSFMNNWLGSKKQNQQVPQPGELQQVKSPSVLQQEQPPGELPKEQPQGELQQLQPPGEQQGKVKQTVVPEDLDYENPRQPIDTVPNLQHLGTKKKLLLQDIF